MRAGDRGADHCAPPSVLDLILFSGHARYLTSKMHLASVRENYRELAEKNSGSSRPTTSSRSSTGSSRTSSPP